MSHFRGGIVAYQITLAKPSNSRFMQRSLEFMNLSADLFQFLWRM